MPTYAYACTDCAHDFEVVQSFSDDTLTVCPECEGRLRKVFSNVGVVFKGSGFYRNDSRSGSSSNSEKTSEKSSDKSSDKSSEKSSDKKSESVATKGADSGSKSASAGSAA